MLLEGLKGFSQKTSLLESTVEKVDFDLYNQLIEWAFYDEDILEEGLLDSIKSQLGNLKSAFSDIKKYFVGIAEEFGIAIKDLIAALKQREMFAILKFVGFSIKKLFKILNDASSLWSKGLLKIFEEIAKTDLIKKLNQGLVTMDEVLNRYPILKKLTGPIVAGILIYIWLNMTFIGDLDYDFNFTTVLSSLTGSFSLEKIFGGPSGMMLLTLFSTGGYASVPWLGTTAANLALALTYTAIKLYQADHPVAVKIRSKVKLTKIR